MEAIYITTSDKERERSDTKGVPKTKKLVPGKWYYDKYEDEYFEVISVCDELCIRRAPGSDNEQLVTMYIPSDGTDRYVQSDIMPDMNKFREGDACFAASEWNTTIVDIFDGNIRTEKGIHKIYSNHPTLFDRYSQFLAYHREQWLKEGKK